ncbi:hypothetical protein [Rhodanobacter sp. C05]|jgi:hypothetical protein|uniref:hypothetical protein n=1 Tax=Rhodanobacter sp. C05 TaxID=1945855 RepID=UPI000987AA55|nr:hypothetical protein [Rhodanobacter sp. C05]OOG43682.1 hypothetical protein B0E51_02545 [Rhodanobacter sp. C05]
MKPFLHRTLMAYRLLYLRGLLMDGQYKFPISDGTNVPQSSTTAGRPRQRMLLAALTGLCQHGIFHRRSKS